MVYKFANLIQDHIFENIEDFLLDVEDVFVNKIDYEKTHDYGCITIIAPKTFIETVFYHLVFSPHCVPEIQTRFSMFEEYGINELIQIFNDDTVQNLAFAINSDRVCFIEEVDKFHNIFDEDEGNDFYYIHNDSKANWINKANNNRILCFDFDT